MEGRIVDFGSQVKSKEIPVSQKNLKSYIDAFKSRKVREIEKEIAILQKRLNIIKLINCNIDMNLPQ